MHKSPHAHVYRGKNFEDHCRKSQVDMDDVLPGVIIDAVLGIDMNETTVFKGQLDDIMYYIMSNNPKELKRARKEVHAMAMGGRVGGREIHYECVMGRGGWS